VSNEIDDIRDDDACEAFVREALDRAGRSAPFRVDVADTVMARVAEYGPAPSAELSWKQFTRWAIAASIVGVLLLFAAAAKGPALSEVAQSVGGATADTVDAAAKLSQPASSLAAMAGRTTASLVDAARDTARPLASMAPLAELVLGLIAAGMLAFTAFIVGRDWRAGIVPTEQA
jgi:hypothetical protein